MSKDLTDSIEQLNGSVRNYIKVNIDLIKLTLIEKAAKIVSIVYILMVVLFFFLLIIATGIAAFAVWYGETYNDYVGGLLIAGGGLFLITLLLVIVGKKLLSNTIIRSFGSKMFKDEKE
ncbi:MAG TPA: phage holin family protein [Mariniphaga sp.]|nr:phage holin family protein [Mariniphaga sp.]